MDEATDTAPMVTALRDLRQVISACSFSLSAQQTDERRAERDHLRREIDGLIARISSLGSPLLVVVGGTTGSGKSTIARALAARLDVPHVDTGAYYRALTLAVLRAGVEPTNEAAVLDVMAGSHVDRKDNRTLLDGVRLAVPEVVPEAGTLGGGGQHR